MQAPRGESMPGRVGLDEDESSRGGKRCLKRGERERGVMYKTTQARQVAAGRRYEMMGRFPFFRSSCRFLIFLFFWYYRQFKLRASSSLLLLFAGRVTGGNISIYDDGGAAGWLG